MNLARPLLVALALRLAGPAQAACPPPERALQGVHSASRIQIEQLGAEDTRIETPLAHVPGRTLGYEVQGVFRVSGAAAAALQRTFGRRDSYACEPGVAPSEFSTPGPLPIGLLFGSRGAAVAVVLHLPEGQVEIQREGEAHSRAPLSRAGQRRWEVALLLLARETRTSPDEFYRQMLPPDHAPSEPAPAVPAPDSARVPRDGARTSG